MRRVTCLLMLTVLVGFIAEVIAEVVTFDNNWGEKPLFNVVFQSATGVEIIFSMKSMVIEEMTIDGIPMKTFGVPGIFLPNDEGAPNLAGTGRYIAIPQGADVKLTILSSRTEVHKNVEVAPAPNIPFNNDNSPLRYEKNMSVYGRDAYYPETSVKLSRPEKIRGVDVVILGITPFQYNPVTKDLIVYKDIRVKVDFIDGNGHFGEDRLRSRFWEPTLKGNLLNYASLPRVDFNRVPLIPIEDENVEYLIIVPDDPDFIAWADTIKAWRKLQGITTGVVTLSEIGGNDATLIEDFVDDAYSTWDPAPVAVLLLSDYQSSGRVYGITSPIWNSYCVSDNIYADFDGDNLPDMVFARITAQDEVDLAEIVTKFLDYERNPPVDPGFHNYPITAGGWQDDRWFILSTEICWGFMHNILDKDPVREYAGYTGTPSSWSTNPNTYMLIDYFGPNGLGYIPEIPSHLNDWGANATRINNDINSGAFLILHRDHGSETGWSEPDYDIGDLSGLNNDMLPFVLSINCLTGKYNWGSQCFTEAFHRMEHGALGLIAASEVSYSFVNDTYIFGFFDYLWPGFDPGHGEEGLDNLSPCFANASGKYYLQASNWPYNPEHKVYTHHLFHHHGDAFITLYSEVPQNLTVLHDPTLVGGSTEFIVTADEGALIGLTVNGEIIGVAEGTGVPVVIEIEPQLPGNTMIVTATKPNYYRHSADVTIITPAGPYVLFDSCNVDDIFGNNDGLVDAGESIVLGVQLKNVGLDTAYNVAATLSSADSYVTITDSYEPYDTIPNDGTNYVADAFAFDVSLEAPDGHKIEFQLEVSGTSLEIWTSHFSLQVHAPVVEFVSVVVDDITGNNNGILDPGETADLIVTLENSGSGQAGSVSGILSESDPFVTISDNYGSFGDIAPDGGSGDNSADVFVVSADVSCPMGYQVTFNLALSAGGGYEADLDFDLFIGSMLSYSPSSFYVTAQPGDVETLYLVITNNGEGPLYYNLSTEVDIFSGSMPAVVWQRPEPLGYRRLDTGKAGMVVEPYFPPVITNQGGPDNFGHRWIDSDEPGGPEFDWIDISAIGTPIDFGSDIDDGNSGPISLGFSFWFYSNEFSFINVCTNGWASFTDGSSVEWGNPPIPDPEPPNDLLATFYDDLNFENGGTGYFYTNNADTAIMTWDHVPDWREEGIFTFQIILIAPARIIYQYSEMGPGRLDECSIGIENANGGDGLEVVHDASYMHNDLAVLFYTEWLSAFPASGVVDPHESFDATITFDASMLSEGTYTGNINLESNDPNNPDVDIPCTFAVSLTYDTDAGASAIISPPDTMQNGLTYSLISEITNYGTEPQTFDVIYEIYISGSPTVEVADTFTMVDMPASNIDTVTFTRTFMPVVDTTYSLVSYTVLEGDLNNSNDTSTAVSYCYTPVSIWYGNVDGSPIIGFVNSRVGVEVYIQTPANAYIADMHLCLGTDDQYIDSLLSDTEGELFYPLSEWDDAGFLGPQGSPPNPAGWSSQSFMGWADLGGDPNPWLHFETPTEIMTFVVKSVDDELLIGDTVACFGAGVNTPNGASWAGDTLDISTYVLFENFSQLCFVEQAGCDYVPGDINGDSNVMGNDVTYGVRYFKGLGDAPPDSCPYQDGWLYAAGDANGNCSYAGSDVTFLVGFFKGVNPSILWCPETPPIGGPVVVSRNSDVTPVVLPKE